MVYAVSPQSVLFIWRVSEGWGPEVMGGMFGKLALASLSMMG